MTNRQKILLALGIVSASSFSGGNLLNENVNIPEPRIIEKNIVEVREVPVNSYEYTLKNLNYTDKQKAKSQIIKNNISNNKFNKNNIDIEITKIRQVGDGLKVYVMCEIPSNVILADKFAKRFDGFSIGSNDLTQLVLGVDRDSEELSFLFDANNEAVKKMIKTLIPVAHKNNCKVGICGQAPSDSPSFAKFLIDEKIDSISLNPDSVVDIIKHIAKFEKKK